MPTIRNIAREKLEQGELSLGCGVRLTRSVEIAIAMKSAGFDWLFLDLEHGTMSIDAAAQIATAALDVGIAPLARVPNGEYAIATRLLDNGVLGIVVPHVDTPALAKRVAEAFRFPPQGHRSWGGGIAVYGFQAPAAAQAQAEINAEVLIIAMIETAEAVGHADRIAAQPGIDVLLIGTSDLTADMGISGGIGHERVQAAYRTVIDACKKHGKHAGMGGVYDEVWAKAYINMGCRFLLGGADQGFILQAATSRAKFLHGLV